MDALIQREPALPAVQSEAAGFVAMLERASRDPAVDIDKLERLMAMHERMLNRNAEAEFYTALSAMQPEFPELPERGKILNKAGGVQSKYTLWEDLNQIIKPILTKHGFALTFLPGNDGGDIVVTGVLSHKGGHVVRSTMKVPLDVSGSKNNVQGLGSSTQYGKRYVAISMLNLTSRGEDDDGKGGKLLPKTELQRYLETIELCESMGQTDTLWAEISEATTKAGDVPANEELRVAMAARRKALKGAK